MPRLIVNPDTESAWEIPLQRGISSLGRAEDNAGVIPHESVSSHHCELTISEFGVTVRDLGSANGTFVDGQLIEESTLQAGQFLQLGDVRLRLADSPAVKVVRAASTEASVSARAAPATATSAAHCRYHPRNPSRFLCPKCQHSFCEMCVNVRSVGGTGKHFCRTCGVECQPVAPPEEIETVEDAPFGKQIVGAFKYPFKGDGLILIAAGTVFFLLVDGARSVAGYGLVFGWFAVAFLTVLGTGYLMAYLRRILNASAMGEEEMPQWPEITEFSSDVVSPFVQFLITVVVSFAPVLGLTIYAAAAHGDGDTSWLGWATMSLTVLGCVYFPMAFTAVAMYDSVMALNPLLIIPSIVKVLKEYLLTVIMLAFILLVRWLLGSQLKTVLPIPVVPTLLFSLIQLYLMIVMVRILGLLYREKKYELGWFD